MSFSKVVLPNPEGATIATLSPDWISKFKELKIFLEN